VRNYEVVLGELLPPLERQFFALASDEAAILDGTKLLEPLVLRTNEGECLEIGVRNRSGERGSLSVSKLLFDAQGSQGTAVGFNLDSTVDRDAYRVYRFYADQELGTSMFFSLADEDSAVDGAYGAIIVEPAGSVWRDPTDGSPVASGTVADIITPSGEAFREQVLLFEDDDDQIGANTMPYPTVVQNPTGINYQSDPFNTLALDGRLDINPDPELVYDSGTHGDPATVLRAYVGDDVRLRVGVGSGLSAATGSHGKWTFPALSNFPPRRYCRPNPSTYVSSTEPARGSPARPTTSSKIAACRSMKRESLPCFARSIRSSPIC